VGTPINQNLAKIHPSYWNTVLPTPLYPPTAGALRGGAWTALPSRLPGGNRGAPPRGVDVKPPSPGGPGPAWEAQEGPPGPGSPGSGIRDPGDLPDRVPGPLPPGEPRGGPGTGSREPGPGPRAGVLHQPLAPRPRGSPPGVSGDGVPGGPSGAFWEAQNQPPPWRGSRPPLPDLPGNRGAPARGVDVKPPPGDPGIRDFRPPFGDFPQNRGFGVFLAR